MQARERGDDKPARVGFTVTRKLGNAVARNRIKRRLRAATWQIWAERAKPGHDYIIIGRRGTTDQPFEKLVGDIDLALQHLNNGESQPTRHRGEARLRGIKTSGPADRS